MAHLEQAVWGERSKREKKTMNKTGLFGFPLEETNDENEEENEQESSSSEEEEDEMDDDEPDP